jgi:hypothetical protein
MSPSAVQTEQAFHDAHLHNTDDGTAFIATQFHLGVFNDGDYARYNSHQRSHEVQGASGR